MAVLTCFSSPRILVQKSGLAINPVTQILMVKQTHDMQVLKKYPALLVRSALKNKVFENRSEGILCYRDDSGEIICEGFDEGPRFHQRPRTSYHPRDAEIINLLQDRLLVVLSLTVLTMVLLLCQRTAIGMDLTNSADQCI